MDLNTTMFANKSSLNISDFQPPNTAFLGYLHLVITIFSFISSTFILTVYAKSHQLWTPFSVYVVSLAIFDLANSCTNRFTLISNFLQIPWVLGSGYCLFALFCQTVITGSIIHTQALISVNRLWAVTFPNHYRLNHSRTLAVCCEIAVVTYMSAWVLPGFIITDQLSHWNPHLCMVNFADKRIYFALTGICTHFFPQIFIIALYPIIYWKVRVIMRRKVRVMTKDHPATTNATVCSVQNGDSHNRGSTVEPTVELQKDNPRLKKQRDGASGQKHFAVLTAMLFSVVVLWTPVHVAYALLIGMDYLELRLVAVGSLLEAVDCTLNPLLCLLVSREWREAAKGILSRSR